MLPSLAFIGAGKVATALALRLQVLGYPIVGITSRTSASAASLAQLLNCPIVDDPSADLIFLTLPDDILLIEAPHWAGKKNNAALVHTSGVHSLDVFGTDHAARVGSFHPMYPFRAGTRLQGDEQILFGIEASDIALEARLVDLARHLEGTPAILKPGSKTQYHAAAVMASNYLVVLFAASLNLLQSAGVPAPQAQAALNRLMQGNVDNLRTLLPDQALTGPIARGDLATVERHLQALEESEYQNLYRVLGEAAVQIASQLSAEKRQALHKLLLKD